MHFKTTNASQEKVTSKSILIHPLKLSFETFLNDFRSQGGGNAEAGMFIIEGREVQLSVIEEEGIEREELGLGGIEHY